MGLKIFSVNWFLTRNNTNIPLGIFWTWRTRRNPESSGASSLLIPLVALVCTTERYCFLVKTNPIPDMEFVTVVLQSFAIWQRNILPFDIEFGTNSQKLAQSK